ncbi:hypothetical protein ASC77_06525 [Nocardioides sp. Root1257]|nr:hypothetical protein ASC77_06525 [Nocardioides sp. Root1257]KRC47586.1 hypothetical protein ASE24_06525 [Nocardioides sp. Root224]
MVASICRAIAAGSGSVNAAARNAPSTAVAVCTASSPLPRTSPTMTRTPNGVSATSYRSPPTIASAVAET